MLTRKCIPFTKFDRMSWDDLIVRSALDGLLAGVVIAVPIAVIVWFLL